MQRASGPICFSGVIANKCPPGILRWVGVYGFSQMYYQGVCVHAHTSLPHGVTLPHGYAFCASPAPSQGWCSDLPARTSGRRHQACSARGLCLWDRTAARNLCSSQQGRQTTFTCPKVLLSLVTSSVNLGKAFNLHFSLKCLPTWMENSNMY